MRFSTLALIALVVAPCGCDEPEKPLTSSTSATPSAASAAAAASAPAPRSVPLRIAVASGPKLGILAGKGIDPIRLGATVETVERLMQRPCDERTEQVCRYVSRAVELQLRDGVVHEIRVHRLGRTTGTRAADGGTLEYGTFNGGFSPAAVMGMLPWAIQDVVGKPQRVETVKDGGPHGTAERHHYPGMVLEYDKNPENGKLILGGVRIFAEDAG